MQRSLATIRRAISQYMVWWKAMPSYLKLPGCVALATVACSGLFIAVGPSASAAPAFDGQGYIDSTARCTAPDTVVVFGSTATSRVAICRSSDGDYQYRGVRVRDGAKLIAPASRSSDGAFTATNDGIQYMVTSSALVISAGERVIRDETMLDFHRPSATTTPRSPTVTSPTVTSPPVTGTTAAPTSTTPLPPPLPAEVGGS